jgi:hypothetical protein
MYMQDKFQKARWIIFKIGFAAVAVIVLWKLIVR